MRKTRLATYAVALTLAAAAMTGISTETAHAEDAVQAVATDTDAAETTEAPAVEETTEAGEAASGVQMDEETVEAFQAGYYNLTTNGGSWDGTYYTLDGTTVANAFFCDGTYTYYLQADGTPMKDRLTYHPDGKHVIYFDANGHEVFNDFATITKTISGDPVNDVCFFDVHGYMYVNQLTYDKTGTKIYFINEYGLLESGKWVKVNNATYFDQDYTTSGYAYAQADGSLLTNQFTYDRNGNMVYVQGNGLLATGLKEIGWNQFYLFDPNDGHLLQTYTSMPGEYSLTYYYDDSYEVVKYNGYENLGSDTYSKKDQSLIGHSEIGTLNGVRIHSGWYIMDGQKSTYTYTYDMDGKDLTDELEYPKVTEDGKTVTGKDYTNYLYYADGRQFYNKTSYYEDGVLVSTYETYRNDDEDNCKSSTIQSEYKNGKLSYTYTETYYEEIVEITTEDGYTYEDNRVSSSTYTEYDAAGNVIYTYTTNYDKDGNPIE